MDSVATKDVADATADLSADAQRGDDVVIGVGQVLGDALGDVAAANPGVHVIGVDAAPGATHDGTWNTNGESLFFAEDQQGYMAGVLAALLSHNRNVGVVGGLRDGAPGRGLGRGLPQWSRGYRARDRRPVRLYRLIQ